MVCIYIYNFLIGTVFSLLNFPGQTSKVVISFFSKTWLYDFLNSFPLKISITSMESDDEFNLFVDIS